MPLSRLGCPLSLKTPNMGNTGLGEALWLPGNSPSLYVDKRENAQEKEQSTWLTNLRTSAYKLS